jgi:hypothetical protein
MNRTASILIALALIALTAAASADLLVTETKLTGGNSNSTRYGTCVALQSNTVVAVGEFNSLVFVDNGGSWSQQTGLGATTVGNRRIVALEGDLLLAGAPFGATLWVRTGSTWSQGQMLTNDAIIYGTAVALSGDTAVIGDPTEENAAAQNDAGAAYVFVRSNGVWSLQQRLTPTVHPALARFGGAVAIDGDSILVGARDENTFGAAYVFVRNGSTWTQQVRFAPSTAAGDSFGNAVAIQGNTAVIGASGEGAGGAAYVFTRSGTTWTQQRRFLPGTSGLGGTFAEAIGLDGDLLLLSNRAGAPSNGTAIVYSRSGTNWFEQGTITPSDVTNNTQFANSIALDGQRAAIGAPFDRIPSGFLPGAVYVYDITVTGPLPECLLAPTAANLDITAGNHTVTATVSSNAAPLAGIPVTFAVITGPNTGAAGTNTTDGAGQAAFQYTNNGLTGTDTIRAISSLGTTCTATVVWSDSAIDLNANWNVTFGVCSNTTKAVLCPINGTLTLRNKSTVYAEATAAILKTCKTNTVPAACKLKGTLTLTQFDLTGLPAHSLAFYLSTDTILDTGDFPMQTLALSKFSAAFLKDKPLKMNWKIPKGVDLAGKYILVIVDAPDKMGFDAVAEVNEDNNISASPAIPAIP